MQSTGKRKKNCDIKIFKYLCMNTHTNSFKMTLRIFLDRVKVMVINATFNNISGILWRSDIMAEEIGGPGENHIPATSHWQTLSQNVV